jgi:TonB-linked SusC/RagA family outer membrane protein
MQKNLTLLCFRKESISKVFLRMKLLTFFMLIAVTSVSAKSYSQPTTLTFNLDNVTVSQVFREIEQNSDYILIYNEKTLDINRKVTVIADNDSIETILDKVFTGTKNIYKISGRQIVVFESESASPVIDMSTYDAELQQVVVSGTVTDQQGLPVIGVTVVVKGTTLGTLTDGDGKFTLSIPKTAQTLVFSFVGMQTQEVLIGTGNIYNVVLSPSVVGLEEVVVVGYSTQKKESVVGAITQVNSSTIIKSGESNITTAIAGKLSGVQTIQQTGQPGANQAEIIVRGLSSWSGSAPLILVDGVERDFSDMDPNEISSVSVLKDASATAVFGSKGANGVIIVTTKRGFLGKSKMTFTGSTGIEVPTRIPSFVDSYTTMSMLNVARMNNQQFTLLTPTNILNEYRHPSTPLKALQYPNVNWFDVNAKAAAPTSNANISIVGGTDFVKYFCSLGYLYEGSFFKQEANKEVDSRFLFHKFNFRTNLDFTLTKTTQLSLNVGGEVGIKNGPTGTGSGFWTSFYASTSADFPAYFPAWVLEQVPDTDYPDATGIRRSAAINSYFQNPYNDINSANVEKYLTTKLFTDLILDQKLDFILKGLSVKGKVAFNTYYVNRSLYSVFYINGNRKVDDYIPTYVLHWDRIGVDANGDGIVDQNPWERTGQGIEYYKPLPLTVNVGGLEYFVAGSGGYLPQNAFSSDLYYEMGLNYNNTFGNHTVTGLVLMNRQQKNVSTEFPYYNAAFVGRATYAYSNKYLAEINIGYTGSERFAPGNRYGFFPSAALGWVISEESFFKNAVPWMNKLKIRYSDGLVGSDAASSRWLYMSDYFLDLRGNICFDKGANTSAQWEEARKKDIGFEVAIFKNLFTFSVDLFDEQRTKMLLTPRSATFLIGNLFKDLNLGSLKKHGMELEVEFNKTTANKTNYFIKGNFGVNENRVIFKDDPVYAPDYTKAAGKPLDAMLTGVIMTGTGYYTSINDIHINPSPIALQSLFVGDYKFLDYDANGTIDIRDSYPIKGHTYAPVTYSLSSGFSYKGFEFNFMFQGSYGNYITLSTQSEVEFYKGSARVHFSQLDYWRPDNQDATHSTLHYTSAEGGDVIHSWGSTNWLDHFWRDASYLRLKEIYAGYNLNSGFLKQLAGISNMLIYINATDLLTFTKLIKEFDPEIKSFGGGWYPQLSRYNLGVKFAF